MAALQPRTIDVPTVLSWLPVDTETVVVADVRKGSFLTAKTFKRGSEDDKNHALSVNEISEQFESMPLGFLGMKDGSLATLLDKRHIVLAVEGSRHFRPPKELGEMTFEGCEIAVFTDNLASAEDLLKRFSKGVLGQEQLEGRTVNVFEEKLEADTWTTFLTFPEPRVLLVATNREYLQQVLRRMKKPSSDRALPESLPEWKYINASAPFWGLRHYDKSQAHLNPSSPFGGSKTANSKDENAIGLVFTFDPFKGRTATITYITAGATDSGLLKRAFSSTQAPEVADLQVTARELAPGVVERSFQLSKSDSVSYFFFILHGILGHAIYL
jgi:hypothetical protein